MELIALDKWFRRLYGQPCWGIDYSRQLSRSINFGKPRLDIREPYKTDSKSQIVKKQAASRRVVVRGQWWLWINCCHWRLTVKDCGLAASSSSLRRIAAATRELNGQKLIAVAVAPKTGATRFVFDLGCVLHCRRFDAEDDSDLWILYQPRGYILSIDGHGRLCHERSGARTQQILTLGQ
jgi:hypothetical protein